MADRQREARYAREVVLERRRVLLLSPCEAGRFDSTMQDWLALPVSEDDCPDCGGPYWGTRNPTGYFLVRECHNGCGATWRGAVTPETIARVVSALNGEEVRLGR